MSNSRPALFVDRDGVLLPDVHLLTEPSQVVLEHGVPEAVLAVQQAGFAVILVSNQTVVSRGLCTEHEVRRIHEHLVELLQKAGCAPLDACYFCPHHPHAEVAEYRVDCECRKPRPGMLLRAEREHGIALSRSVMAGDRASDVIAGSRAGCKTVLITSGQHLAPSIVGVFPGDLIEPDYAFPTLLDATPSILSELRR